jgi:Carbamate kinase
MKSIVVALGGNALGKTPEEQLELVKQTASSIVDLTTIGYNVVISHGNGPQVGIINQAFEENNNVCDMPFAECGAMSQGYIGYHLQQAIKNELKARNIDKNCATLVTQVLVDKSDPAFDNPDKPVGIFYTQDKANEIALEKGYTFMEDSGRGYRRVVPSPKPIEIIELDLVKDLMNQGNIVITAGGGGIPVIKESNSLKGIAAVIDKDRTSSLLAKELGADILLILTTVENVLLNFNSENEIKLHKVSTKELKNI